ncbi:hypothetical protein GF380_01685 [Candidatus Uhrbacteria bacterium]|nr:hypothetical protein [Candidatus Uhrbacteria bacterium]MBD3283974.1 hypothetical protein [Candidatus Uhrbacteria bacterium]
MTLNYLVAVLAAVAMQANPAPASLPQALYEEPPPEPVEVRSPVKPTKVRTDSFGIETSADAVILVDVSSGAVLYGKQAEVAYPVASITKIMTAMVLLDQGYDPEGILTVASQDLESIGRHWYGDAEQLNRGEAFRAMLVQSVNELANAFAREYPGGRAAFVEAMNQKAYTLGLEHTFFTDPSGISPENRASALDVARMFRSAIAYPEIREVTQSGAFTMQTLGGRSVKLDPTNNLLTSYLNQDPYRVVAAKTGSLPEAGYCLGQVTTHPDGQQVISVVLGSDNHFGRFQELKALTAWAFDTFSWNQE